MTAEAFLSREQQLHQTADADGSEIVWVWEANELTVVLGRSSPMNEVRTALCARDNVPVLRRESGGGIVLLGRGCLNYSLLLNLERRPWLRDVEKSYGMILGVVASCLDERNVRREGSDLLTHDRKFSGSSQRRRKRSVLHHGTLLYEFAIDVIDRYIHEPQRRPAHRNQRTHTEFLTNVSLPSDFAHRLASQFPEAQAVT